MRRAWGSAMTVALVLLAVPAAAPAQQGSNFNRLNTVRREVTVSPARAVPGRGGGALTETSMPGELGADPLRPYTGGTMAASSSSSSGSQTRRTSEPMSVQTRTTPHTFYPGMRAAQGPNRNVAPRCTHSRAAFLAPGMMGPSAGMMGSTSAKSRSQR
jgi:hypothetical protein